MQFFVFDASYVERLRSGDARVEAHFVSYFSELIRLKLRSRLSSNDAIEDVRQETFSRVIGLLRTEGGLRHADRLGAFVNSICNNILLEHYRSTSKKESSLDEEPETVFVHQGPTALTMLETQETTTTVRKILDQLTERDRNLLKAVLLDERDKDTVCAEFGISREYLRVLVHRAKQSFKSLYLRQMGEKDSF